MKTKNKYFVIPNGDELNDIIAENFENAEYHSLVTVVKDGVKTHAHAWEVDLKTLEALRIFLKTAGFNIDIQVAIQIDEGQIRFALKEEYNSGYKHQKKLEKSVRRRTSKTAVMRAPRVQRKKDFFKVLEPVAPKISVPEHPEFLFEKEK